MACRHGDYEGATCAHCGESTPKRRELAERIRQAIADQHDQCACLVWQDCPHALEAIERVLEQEER